MVGQDGGAMWCYIFVEFIHALLALWITGTDCGSLPSFSGVFGQYVGCATPLSNLDLRCLHPGGAAQERFRPVGLREDRAVTQIDTAGRTAGCMGVEGNANGAKLLGTLVCR